MAHYNMRIWHDLGRHYSIRPSGIWVESFRMNEIRPLVLIYS